MPSRRVSVQSTVALPALVTAMQVGRLRVQWGMHTIMTQAMVCAAQPEAVEAGAEVLAAGGNAVDAAVATALTQTAVDRQMCGIAGFGSMHIYKPGAEHACLDFYGRAPLAATPECGSTDLSPRPRTASVSS